MEFRFRNPDNPAGLARSDRLPGGRATGDEKMGDDKSIRQKIADGLKDLANIAANAANDALKAEASKPKSDEAASYIPFAAEGLVSDPMLVPPLAAVPRKRKRVAAKPVAKSAVRKTATKAAKKSAAGKSKKRTGNAAKKATKKATKKAAKKTTNKTATKTKNRATRKVRKSTRRKRVKT
jgi:hypothetical protein